MRTITKIRSSAKYMNDVNTVERSGIHGRSRSYAHKTEINGFNTTPRATDAVTTQISVLLNRIRTESCR
jgi:hypothetical protein